MFWSPAVMRLSVTCACAAASRPTASPANVAMMLLSRFMPPPCPLCVLRLRVLRRRIEVQCRCRQGDADRLADREPARVVDHIIVRPDAHGLAVEPAGIGALDDLPPQDQAAVGGLIQWTKPPVLAPEMTIDVTFPTLTPDP